MLRALYTSASGLNAEMLEQDVVANNIANATTLGYKKDAPVFEAFPNRLLARIHDRMDQPRTGPVVLPAIVSQNLPPQTLGYVGQGVKAAGTVTQFTAGSLSQTGGMLDLALEGNGLFSIQRADGSAAYMRAGNFTVNSEKQLCTQDGDLVLAKSGQPIVVDGKEVVVDSAGGVKVDGSDKGTLDIVAYDPQRFTKSGENLYVKAPLDFEGVSNPANTPPVEGKVLQGYVEQSNVEIVTEMVHMITLMRAYETNTKNITMQDQTLSMLFTNVGTPSA